MEILLVLSTGLMCLVCFIAGAIFGQPKGKHLSVPVSNPVKAHREKESREQAQKEQQKLEVIMRNIEAYDGTERGQEDVPRW